MVAGLRWRWRPALGRWRVEGQGGQAQALGGLRTHLAPPGGLSVGEGDPLQVDGSFHSLEQKVPLFGLELEVPLARVTPPTRLKGEGGLRTERESGLNKTSVIKSRLYSDCKACEG